MKALLGYALIAFVLFFFVVVPIWALLARDKVWPLMASTCLILWFCYQIEKLWTGKS